MHVSYILMSVINPIVHDQSCIHAGIIILTTMHICMVVNIAIAIYHSNGPQCFREQIASGISSYDNKYYICKIAFLFLS